MKVQNKIVETISKGRLIDNDFKELFKQNLVLSCDTECFPDYWSFIFKRIGNYLKTDFSNYQQIKYNPDTKVYIFECWNDNDCIRFAQFYKNFILKNKAVCYFYNSDGYDKPMINIHLNLVKNKQTNILKKLRTANDYIIKNKMNYKLFTHKYWENFFKDQRKHIVEKELFDSLSNPVYKNFYKEFGNCFVNKCTKSYDETLGKIH